MQERIRLASPLTLQLEPYAVGWARLTFTTESASLSLRLSHAGAGISEFIHLLDSAVSGEYSSVTIDAEPETYRLSASPSANKIRLTLDHDNQSTDIRSTWSWLVSRSELEISAKAMIRAVDARDIDRYWPGLVWPPYFPSVSRAR